MSTDVFSAAVRCLSAMAELTPPQRRRLVSVLTASIDLGDEHELAGSLVRAEPLPIAKEPPQPAAPKAPGGPKREAVLEAVARHQEGATASQIAAETGLPAGTVSWHMRHAEQEGTLRCTPNGNRTRYFRVTGTPTPPRPVRNARAQDVSEMQGRILQLIKKERLTPIEIANSLGLSRTDYVFRKAMQAIRESGKVTIVSQGSRRSYHLTGSQSA